MDHSSSCSEQDFSLGMAGIEGHKTNHNLHATGATALYQADVPENIIQERTGHLSLKGLYDSMSAQVMNSIKPSSECWQQVIRPHTSINFPLQIHILLLLLQ